MKNIKIFLVILLASVFLFFLKNEAYTLTCIPSIEPTYIAICENNVCKEGFEIYYERTRGCDTIPTVKENVLNLDEIFQIILSQNNIQNARGIYEIGSSSYSYYCSSDGFLKNKDNWNRDCTGGAVVTRLSESTSIEDLYSYKSQWLSKEAEELKLVGEDKRNKILASIIPAILIIGWPLVIIAIRPLRRRLNLTALLVAAIIVNLGFYIFKSIFSISLGFEYPEEVLVDDIILWSILLVVILEVFFLIFRIGKRLFHRAQ